MRETDSGWGSFVDSRLNPPRETWRCVNCGEPISEQDYIDYDHMCEFCYDDYLERCSNENENVALLNT